jgi:hypothetical protein
MQKNKIESKQTKRLYLFATLFINYRVKLLEEKKFYIS